MEAQGGEVCGRGNSRAVDEVGEGQGRGCGAEVRHLDERGKTRAVMYRTGAGVKAVGHVGMKKSVYF